MAEVPVVKKAKEEAVEPVKFPKFDFPFFRGHFFNMSPFAIMKQFADEMDQAFTHMPKFAGNGEWSPAIEVKHKDGKFVLTADLPGVKKEDVKVHVDEDMLVVEGERKFEKEEKKEGYFHSERSYGKFYRSMQLPAGAKIDATAANFANGVLEVTVPVPEVKPKRQDVPVAEGEKKAA